MTAKRFEFNKDMNLDSKVETYELSCIVDNSNKTFYFVVDSIANVESFVERLNELYEENQDFKAFNKELAEELSVCANARISKDNRIERLEEKIQRERTSFTKTQGRWSKEAETKIKELSEENEQLKKALLFFYDVANCECSTNWKGDMEKGCKRFFNCTYEEAEEKYGDYDGMWWELE